MMFFLKRKPDLQEALCLLADEIRESRQQSKIALEWFKSHLNTITAKDLDETEKRILMKLSEIKAAVATAAGQSTEAFNELSGRIGELQKQIDDLIAGVSDPEVTDESFAADLETLKVNTQALADIVKTTPPVEPPSEQ